jgi:thiamine-monophosphate kinase
MTPARGEDRLTARIAAAARPGGRRPRAAVGTVRVGIGDDAAVVDLPRGRSVLTTDTLVEGVDFFPGELPFWIGRRAAAANLSDLAAMGAFPAGFLLSIAVRRKGAARYARRIAEGAISRMRPFGATLWGGDLSRAAATVVTILLVVTASRPVERSGARPGDLLFVTGSPGAARTALRLRRGRVGRRPIAAERPYLDPEPRVDFGRTLAARRWATAMIDVSDGLGRDARRLAEASRVRLVFEAAGRSGLSDASDDFELLFTSPASRERSILRLGARLSTPVARVGRVERGKGIVLERRDGRREPVAAGGWDHFA